MSDTDSSTPLILDQYGKYIESRVPKDAQSRMMIRMPPQPLVPAQLDPEMVFNVLTQADVGNAMLLMSLYDQVIYSDNHIQGELGKRKLAVLGDAINVAPEDPKNADDVKAAGICKQQINGVASWFDGMAHLLDSTIWPVAIVERLYKLSNKPGLRYDLADLVTVRHELLYMDPTGPLRLWDVDPQTHTITATNQMVDPMRYVTHRGHLLGDRDHRGGPMRSLIFWWLFSGYNRDWCVRFLDKYGSPFLVGKYDQADDDSRFVLQSAFALAAKLGGIVISNETSVEIQQAMSTQGVEAYEAFHEICQAEKSKLIVGQTTSASAKNAGGLSSGGVSDAQENVRGDIREFDRARLGSTVKHQICLPFLRLNGIRGSVTVTWGGENVEDTSKTAASIAALSGAGIGLTDAGITALSERFGLGLQRLALPTPGAPAGPTPLTTLDAHAAGSAAHHRNIAADMANDRLARAGAADLSRALVGDLAPFQRFLDQSTDLADFERLVREKYPAWDAKQTFALLSAGIETFGANGI